MDAPQTCKRVKMRYRGENLYIVICEDAVHLSMANQDYFRTLAGLGLIEQLISEYLRERGLNELKELALSCSYQPGDLPDLLVRAIETE